MQLYCQDHPEIFERDCEVLNARPGAVLLARSPVFPGGGGQLMDDATLTWSGGSTAIRAVTSDAHGQWHEFDGDAVASGTVRVTIDPRLRRLMSELHTLAHIANCIVYRDFGGALLTGAQLAADGTFRLDFDLPGADNDRLRALDGPINDVIRQDLPVRTFRMDFDEADRTPGLFRSKSVSPPRQPDGLVRIVEIGDIDRQGCGGTHLASTGAARRVKILKIENKGRQNRRVRIGLIDAPSPT
ncbi:MAG: alanyl-tRNA editing protein [Pseudomonadota bacterium]|jgi:misacylated tRNA(Ala) deacylase